MNIDQANVDKFAQKIDDIRGRLLSSDIKLFSDNSAEFLDSYFFTEPFPYYAANISQSIVYTAT